MGMYESNTAITQYSQPMHYYYTRKSWNAHRSYIDEPFFNS